VRITVHVNELDQFQELRFQQHATCGVLCTQDKPAVVHFFVQYNNRNISLLHTVLLIIYYFKQMGTTVTQISNFTQKCVTGLL